MTKLNLRQSLLASAMKQADGEELPHTIENLSRFLPSDFELVQDDIDEMPKLELIVDAEFTEIDDTPALAAPDEPEPDAFTVEMAEDRLKAAHERLNIARSELMVCNQNEGVARGNLARAITGFQAGFEGAMDSTTLARHEAMMAARHRAAGNVRQEPQRRHMSMVDLQRAHARSNQDAGHGNSGRAIVEGRKVFSARARGATVPSER